MNSTSATENCVQVAGNIYCNVTRFTIYDDWIFYTSLILTIITLPVFSVMMLVVSKKLFPDTKKVPKDVLRLCKDLHNAAKGHDVGGFMERRLNFIERGRKIACFRISPQAAVFRIIAMKVLFPIMIIFLELVDIAFDSWYAYSYQFNDSIIDPLITRRRDVFLIFWTIPLMSFIIFPVQTSLILHQIRRNVDTPTEELDDHGYILIAWLRYHGVKTFLVDILSLFMEYLFVDIFVTENPPNFTIARDIFSLIVQLFSILFYAVEVIPRVKLKQFPSWIFKVWLVVVTIIPCMLPILRIIQIAGKFYHYSQTTLPRDCLRVDDGRLIQSPRAVDCFQGYDWALSLVAVALTCILVCGSPVLVVAWSLKKNSVQRTE